MKKALFISVTCFFDSTQSFRQLIMEGKRPVEVVGLKGALRDRVASGYIVIAVLDLNACELAGDQDIGHLKQYLYEMLKFTTGQFRLHFIGVDDRTNPNWVSTVARSMEANHRSGAYIETTPRSTFEPALAAAGVRNTIRFTDFVRG